MLTISLHSPANLQLPVAAASGALSCLSGLDPEYSYRNRRSSRAERGDLAYSPAWSELPNRNGGVVIWVRLPPQHVDRMAGTGERKRERLTGNGGDLNSPVGFRHRWRISWLSLTAPTDAPKKRLFYEVCQGGGAYGKTGPVYVLFLAYYAFSDVIRL